MFIDLDYRTNNPRWGLSGINFESMDEYAHTLGFLSNPRHHKHCKSIDGISTNFNCSISIHIEGNYQDGAWAEECRIHYYNSEKTLTGLPALNRARSAGRGDSITYRINSNEYINHILKVYQFRVEDGGYSANVYPPDDYDFVWMMLVAILHEEGKSESFINGIYEEFIRGWNL